MKVLCVAEKPSIAKAVSQILGGGRCDVSNTNNKYIKNYKFTSRFPQWGECDVVFTSVAGHLTGTDFDQQWRKWSACPPVALFDEARIIETIPQVQSPPMQGVDLRDQRGFMIISSRRVDRQRNCSYGQIVIERENILELKLKAPQERGMRRSKSNEQNSTILNERTFLSTSI